MGFPIPHNEARRLSTLRELNILDTAPETRFDRITEIAQAALNVPIVMVSLIDENRQWFKSCQGLNVCETARSASFCTYAILDNEPFVIPDTLTDERFRNNLQVTEEPHIRAYLGIPLTMPNGENIGTLCALDRQPREFSRREIQILSNLGAIVRDELGKIVLNEMIRELQEKTRLLEEKEKALRIAFTESAHVN